MAGNRHIKHGEKTIKMTIHFWTNGIPKKLGLKTAEFKGVVHLNANKARCIRHSAKPFNDKSEMWVKLQELLKEQDVRLITFEGVKDETFT